MDGLTLALWFFGFCVAYLALCCLVHIVETLINRHKSGWYNNKI